MFIRILIMTIGDFVAQHIVWLLPIAALLVFLLMPSVAVAVWRFLTQTLPGQIILACVVASLVGWFLRGYIDAAADRRRDIVAAQAEAARSDTARREADARLAALRAQVAAADRLTAEANDRAATNEAAVLSYQQRESDYEAELATKPMDQRRSCALDDADVRGLRRAAGAFGPRRKAGVAAGARKLRPTRPGA